MTGAETTITMGSLMARNTIAPISAKSEPWWEEWGQGIETKKI
jgi:hypothetical protein